MTGLLTIKDAIRDFLRKYDEITTPIIRFIIALIVFKSVNSMYGYSDLFDKGVVIFLLSVISALVSDIVVVLLVGAVMCVNAFAISVEVGVLFLLIFILMYGLYMRMFPDCSWILILVPVLYTLKIQYSIPIIVAIFVGLPGAVPAAFGIVVFYFSQYAREVYTTLHAAVVDENFQPITYIVKELSKDKEMMVAAIVFAIVIVITNTIHRLSFDYSWYVAIGVGALCNIICFIICGTVLDAGVGGGDVVLGTIIGVLLAVIIQMCKSVVDYSRKESVQFEDDEYYYYVKAIPKLGEPTKEKSVKTMTESNNKERDDADVKRRLAEHAATVSRDRRSMEESRQRQSSLQGQRRQQPSGQSQSRQRPASQSSSRPNPNRK